MASQNCLTDKQTRLLMLEAIKYNNIAKVQQLLNEGINLNRCIKYKDGDWWRSYTPLCIAIAHGSIQLVQLFITSGANVNKSVTYHKPDHQEKFTPLFLACREGQLQIIDLLIQAGALVNVPLSGPRIQEEEGGSIDYNSDVRNNCLHWATMYRKYEQLEKLLQGGGNPRLLNSIQETPLHMACDTYNPPIIRLLARTGGVAAHKDMHGSTPLFKLMFHRGDPSEQIELVKLLLAGGYVLIEETWLNQVRNYLYDTSASNEEANQNPAQIGGQLMATHSRESVEILKSRYGVAFLQWLLDWGTNPHRLKYLCRQAIRDTVGSVRLLQKVRQLPLPLSLINYLQLDQM